MKIGMGRREYESGRWIGGKGDMRRCGVNIANRHVVRIPGPRPFRQVHFFFKVLAADVKPYAASTALIVQVIEPSLVKLSTLLRSNATVFRL